jgi:molecular chaperone DnaJ
MSFSSATGPIFSAALGGEFAVTTLDGQSSKVRVPEGTQTGKQFKLKSKGMPILRSKDHGDLFIQAVVETPQNLSKRQRELLMEFEQEGGGVENNPESAGFFSRMRDFFGGQ